MVSYPAFNPSYISHVANGANIRSNSPAAAAGSEGVAGLLASSEPGLDRRFIGLRSRTGSEAREDGERERLSNRDWRFGSGSVWSNRERLVRLSLSDILAVSTIRAGQKV